MQRVFRILKHKRVVVLINCELSLLSIVKDCPFTSRSVLWCLMVWPLTQSRARSWLMVA